ncbi:MAG: pyridoxamine 5'-phosphate oxidase family protein [Actinomycetota bacterium]
MQPDFYDRFLTEPHVGVLATLRRNGLPYTVPVWWLWHEDAFWLTGTYGRVWCRQLMVDPRCSLCVEAMGESAGHVGVDGSAEPFELPDFDIWPISRLLVDKYVASTPGGDPDAFFANMQTEPRLLFRLEPEDRDNAIRAIDMRIYRGKRSDREHQAGTDRS